MDAFSKYESKKTQPFCCQKGCSQVRPPNVKQRQQDQGSIQRLLQKNLKTLPQPKENKVPQEQKTLKLPTVQNFYQEQQCSKPRTEENFYQKQPFSKPRTAQNIYQKQQFSKPRTVQNFYQKQQTSKPRTVQNFYQEQQSSEPRTEQNFYQPPALDKSLTKDIYQVMEKFHNENKTDNQTPIRIKNRHKDLPPIESQNQSKPIYPEPLVCANCSCLPTVVRHHTKHIPKQTKKQDILNSANDGLHFRNHDFGKICSTEPSDKSNRTYTSNKQNHDEPSNSLTSARKYCKKMNKHFESKFEEIEKDYLSNNFHERYKPKFDKSAILSSDSDFDNHVRSSLEDLKNASSESMSTIKSNYMNISPKTVISAKSGADLRKIVISQIKIQEYIRKCKTKKRNDKLKLDRTEAIIDQRIPNPLEEKQLKDTAKITTRCEKKVIAVPAYHIDDQHRDNLNYIKEKINSKIITPMIGKVKRFYLNHLNEEMTMVEKLERVPDQVEDLYKVLYMKH